MARRSALTSGGRSFLSGKRTSVRKRAPKGFTLAAEEQVVLPTGERLNLPESKIYRALQDLKVNFTAHPSLGGGHTLGGAIPDFLLHDYFLVIEFQGPFHSTTEGAERDFWRLVAREQQGLMTVYLRDSDLVRIHQRLKEIMGAPTIAAVSSRG